MNAGCVTWCRHGEDRGWGDRVRLRAAGSLRASKDPAEVNGHLGERVILYFRIAMVQALDRFASVRLRRRRVPKP